MKILHKARNPNGIRTIYFCGMKLWSYNSRNRDRRFKRLKQRVFIFDDNGEREIFYNCQLPDNVHLGGSGTNNVIRIHKNMRARNVCLTFDKNTTDNTCILNDSAKCDGLDIFVVFQAGTGNKLTIGRNTVINGAKIWLGNGSELRIGDDCMLSYEIIIRTTDGHAIMDATTGAILNNQRNACIIGNHCWVGLRTIVNKNAQIPDNTIVASGTVLTGRFSETHTIIAGNPGRVIKTGVVFSDKSIYALMHDSNQ